MSFVLSSFCVVINGSNKCVPNGMESWRGRTVGRSVGCWKHKTTWSNSYVTTTASAGHRQKRRRRPARRRRRLRERRNFKKSFSKREPEKMPFVQNYVVQHPNKVDFDFWTSRLLPDTWLLHVFKKWALVLQNILIELKNEIVHLNRNVNAAWVPLVVIVAF